MRWLSFSRNGQVRTLSSTCLLAKGYLYDSTAGMCEPRLKDGDARYSRFNEDSGKAPMRALFYAYHTRSGNTGYVRPETPKAAAIKSVSCTDAGPHIKNSWPLISKGTGFTCTTVAPLPRARKGSSAAG